MKTGRKQTWNFQEDKMIKQLCKTFEDTDSYWLNTQRYIEVAAKYNFDPRRMQIKMEMLDLGVNEKIPSKKTIGRVMDYCRGLVRNNYSPSITITRPSNFSEKRYVEMPMPF